MMSGSIRQFGTEQSISVIQRISPEETISEELDGAGNPGEFETSKRNSRETENSSKRKKIEQPSLLTSSDRFRELCLRHYLFSPFSKEFRFKLSQAGLWYCKDRDHTTFCISCSCVFLNWNERIDEPAEIHKVLSPSCLFVKSNLKDISTETTHRKYHVSAPAHDNYWDPSERVHSYATHPQEESQWVQQLVDAGFFRSGSKSICFYCDIAFSTDCLKSDPIFEHLRASPECDFVRGLCGEALCTKIQNSKRHHNATSQQDSSLASRNWNNLESIERDVQAYYDLHADRNQYLANKFSKELIKQCIERELCLCKENCQFDSTGLFIDCLIAEKLGEPSRKDKRFNVNVEMKKMFEKIEFPHKELAFASSNGIQSSDQLRTMDEDSLPVNNAENDKKLALMLQRYQASRKMTAQNFKESHSVAIAREISMGYNPSRRPTPAEMMESGWMWSKSGEFTKCPHCHIEFRNWQLNKHPLAVHRVLSPLCPFALAINPHERQTHIPMKTLTKFCEDGVANTPRQFNGVLVTLTQTGPILKEIYRREQSFGQVPQGPPRNVRSLAKDGFYYTPATHEIKCFWCFSSWTVPIDHQGSQSIWPIPRHHFHCSYKRQKDDKDPYRHLQPSSAECEWCMLREKSIVMMPCKHLAVCDECCKKRQTCPRCYQLVVTYAQVYNTGFH